MYNRIWLSKKAYGYDWKYAEKEPETSNCTITLCENDTPQIEQYPSVRTIYLKSRKRKVSKTQKCRCGNSSVAAAFLLPDTEKALKSRAFGQKEKVGNFYQNYLPFVAEKEGFEPSIPLWGIHDFQSCALDQATRLLHVLFGLLTF